MIRSLELQPWTVLRGEQDYYQIIQEVRDWVDASAHNIGTVTIEAPDMSGCELRLEGCDDQGGAFMDIKALTSSTTTPIVQNMIRAMPVGSPEHLYNHLRWFIKPTAANWNVTFRVTAVLK